jgi:signal transduction histidine kinase
MEEATVDHQLRCDAGIAFENLSEIPSSRSEQSLARAILITDVRGRVRWHSQSCRAVIREWAPDGTLALSRRGVEVPGEGQLSMTDGRNVTWTSQPLALRMSDREVSLPKVGVLWTFEDAGRNEDASTPEHTSLERQSQIRMQPDAWRAATSALAAGIAHEINNPLAYMMLNLEQLRAGISRLERDLLVLDAPDDRPFAVPRIVPYASATSQRRRRATKLKTGVAVSSSTQQVPAPRVRLRRRLRSIMPGEHVSPVAPLERFRTSREHGRAPATGNGRQAPTPSTLGKSAPGVNSEWASTLTNLRTNLGIIDEGTRRVERIVKDLMCYARSEGKPEPVDLRRILGEALELARPSLAGWVNLNVRFLTYHHRILGKHDLLLQLFTHLLSNGIEALDPERAERCAITVVVRSVEPDWVAVEFRDSGRGVPAAIADRIFDPFFSTKPESTGLGLAICSRIAEAIGGELQYEADMRGGSVFRVLLRQATA